MNNKNSKIIIIVLTLLVIGLSSFIVYDKVFSNDNQNINNNETESTNKENLSQDTTGKIYIKRDGIIALEEVPNDIVGKYANSEDDYFILNSDGTAMAINNQRTYQFTYQLTYNQDQFILELYSDNSNEFYYSAFMYGKKHIAGSGATAILMTPSSNPDKLYIKSIEQ